MDAASGKSFYYHSVTGESRWDDPKYEEDELGQEGEHVISVDEESDLMKF